MDEPMRAEAWVQARLDEARSAFRVQPPGPRDSTLEQYEQRLRSLVEACLRPTDQYVGLTLEQASAVAGERGDALCVHRGPTAHRSNWRAARVHVEVGTDEVVRAARRERALWDPPG